MSFRHMATVWDMSIRDATRKLILMGIASYADEDGRCWPSQETLARRVGCSDRTVRAHLAALEAAGWLSREARSGVGGRRSDLYVLRLPPQPENSSGCATGNPEQVQPENSSGCTKEEESTNRNIPPPLPPTASPAPKASPAPEVEIPPELDAPEFRDAWSAWAKERRARGKKLTEQAARLQLRKLAKEAKDPNTASEWIYLAIEKGWQGIYKPKDIGYGCANNGKSGVMWNGFDKIDYSAGQIRGNDGRTYV